MLESLDLLLFLCVCNVNAQEDSSDGQVSLPALDLTGMSGRVREPLFLVVREGRWLAQRTTASKLMKQDLLVDRTLIMGECQIATRDCTKH